MRIEHLNDLGEVKQRAGEPIDLVHDNDVDPRPTNFGQKPLQGWSLQRSAGIAAVVIVGGQHDPAFMLLTGDEGLAGLVLRIEGVEVLLEALLC